METKIKINFYLSGLGMLLGQLEETAEKRGGIEEIDKILEVLGDRESSAVDITSALLSLGEMPIPPKRIKITETLLLMLLDNDDLLISLKSCQLLTRIYASSRTAPLEYYLYFVHHLSREGDPQKIEQLLIFLQDLSLHTRPLRDADGEDPIKAEMCRNHRLLAAVVSLCTMKKVRYQALVLLWILSFSPRSFGELEKVNVFPVLSYVCRETNKEKEVRVALAITKNYLKSCEGPSCQVQKIEDLLHYSSHLESMDAEAKEDFRYCKEKFAALCRHISSFDSYLKELKSGQLQPLQYHFSEDFWANNLGLLMEGRTEILKMLKRYLKSDDPQNIWVAANDVYHFVKAHPEICATLRQFGIQESLFEILNRPQTEDVRFHVMEALSICYTKEECSPPL